MNLLLKSKSLWALLLVACLMLGATGCDKDKKANQRYNTATQAFQQGDFAKALQIFQEINKKYPKYSGKNNVDYQIILCQTKLGQNDAALKGIDLLMIKPGLPPAMQGDLLINRGNIYFNKKEYATALTSYDQALSNYGNVIPNQDAVLSRAAECCEAMSQTERAWTYRDKIPTTSPYYQPRPTPPAPPEPVVDTKEYKEKKSKKSGKGSKKGKKAKGKGKSSKNGSWIIQCGFFKDTKSSEKLVNKLKKAGFKAKYKKSGKGYIVYVGPTSKAEAQRLAPQCAKAGATGAFATKN